MDGLTAIAAVLIASFAIDRIVTGSLFLLSFVKHWTRIFPDPTLLMDSVERAKAEKKQKLTYFVFAGVLAVVVLAGLGEVRIFTRLQFPINPWLDTLMTGLVLVGGADRLAAILEMTGGPAATKPASQPIEFTGRLVLEQGTGQKLTET